MRCQRVRSCLSTYCKDELTGRRMLAVREHLATCESCRREELAYRMLFRGATELSLSSLPPDFTTQVLNRVATERFSETRTKAYLPKPAPRVLWRHVAPVMAGALILAVVAIGAFVPRDGTPMMSFAKTPAPLDDSYLTAQPDNNPNVTTPLSKDWSLRDQLAQSERMSRLTGMLTGQTGFSAVDSRIGWSGPTFLDPFLDDPMFRRAPVIRIYQTANTTMVREDQTVY